MKRKKSTAGKTAQKPSTPAAQPQKRNYPLELVASLAVQLVEFGNYDGAAKSAVALLDACTAVLEGRGKPPAEVPPPPGPRRVRIQPDGPRDMEWNEFLGRLTRKERPDRAEQKISNFFKFDARRSKAVDMALPYAGTISAAQGMWRQFIEQIPEATDADRDAWIKELQLIGGTCTNRVTGEKSFIVARNMVERYQARFTEWQDYQRAKTASENGSKPASGDKKRGRPKKNAEN